MDEKTQQQIKRIAVIAQSWPFVETFAFLVTGKDKFDPDFAISCDVYYTQQVPSLRVRKQALSFALVQKIMPNFDQLLIDEIPLQLFYRNVKEVLVRRHPTIDTISSTYLLWRVMNARIFEESPWLEETRAFLRVLPPEFWEERKNILHAVITHSFTEMHIASMVKDDIRFSFSLSSFFSFFVQYLCAREKRFDPPPSGFSHYLSSSPLLSEDLRNKIIILLQIGTSLSMVQKVEIAQLVVGELL